VPTAVRESDGAATTSGFTIGALLRTVAERFWIVLAFGIFGSGAGVAISAVRSAGVPASVSLYLSADRAGTNYVSPLLVKSYALAASQTAILAHQGALSLSHALDDQLQSDAMAITVPANSQLVVLTLKATSASDAARAAELAGAAFTRFVTRASDGDVRVRVYVVNGAAGPAIATSSTKEYVAVGFIVGVVLGAYAVLATKRRRNASLR
jgi:hypothetical protein